MLIPGRDLDAYGQLIWTGDISGLKADWERRCSEHAPEGGASQISEMRWGPTAVPVFNLILLFTMLNPGLREKYLEIARWLISAAKVPVDGVDLSGSTALYHSVSTKPALDLEYAQMLYDGGANVNAVNRYGGTVAHEVAMIWNARTPNPKAADSMKWILEHGGNVEVADGDGVTVRTIVEKMRPFKQPIVKVVDDETKKRKERDGCTFCGMTGTLSKCGRCKAARYCPKPKSCQTGDWPRHKKECKAP